VATQPETDVEQNAIATNWFLVYCSGVTMKQQVSGYYLPAVLGEGPPWLYLPTNWLR
jgi:hypothetical protein